MFNWLIDQLEKKNGMMRLLSQRYFYVTRPMLHRFGLAIGYPGISRRHLTLDRGDCVRKFTYQHKRAVWHTGAGLVLEMATVEVGTGTENGTEAQGIGADHETSRETGGRILTIVVEIGAVAGTGVEIGGDSWLNG